MNTNDWFYIKHASSGKVISVCDEQDKSELLRSQVIVTETKQTDHELWCWDNQRLKNKESGLVLDIRKGKLRLIEDTEICLYFKKPDESAQNQLWATKSLIGLDDHPLVDNSSKNKSFDNSVIIYSLYNNDWVLDIAMDKQKLVLFPLHHDIDESQKQKWSFIYENDMQSINDDINTGVLETNTLSDDYLYYNSMSSPSFDFNNSSTDFAYGLTPSKRSSAASSIHIPSRSGSMIDEAHIIQLQRRLSHFNT